MFRYLAEPRNILAEPLGSTEPRLKNTDVGRGLNKIPPSSENNKTTCKIK